MTRTKATTCSVGGCPRPVKQIGLCKLHFGRLCRGTALDAPIRASRKGEPDADRPCSIEGCVGLVQSRDWCRPHYERWSRTGSPMPTVACAGCGVTVGWGRKKWCSDACKVQSAGRKAQQKEYIEKNAEAIKVRMQVYRETHAETARARTKQWRKENPEQVRINANRMGQRRRALRFAVKSEDAPIAYLHKRDRGVCGICHKKVSMKFRHPHPLSPSMDHIIPLSKGGDDSRANKQLAHFRCNIRKLNRPMGEQLRLLG